MLPYQFRAPAMELVRSVFCSVEKREPAELGRMEAASNILGSFNYVKILKYNRFSPSQKT